MVADTDTICEGLRGINIWIRTWTRSNVVWCLHLAHLLVLFNVGGNECSKMEINV